MKFTTVSQVKIGTDELNLPMPDGDPDTAQVELTVGNQNVADILEVSFAILGTIAFLVIVLAGLRFILSRGEPDKAAKARNTIIYAAIGLVIAVSAFTLVSFITGAAG